MSEHTLKTWPEFFEKVLSGVKKFEIRKRDRPFAVGDVLRLREWKPFGWGTSTLDTADEVERSTIGVPWPLEAEDITQEMIEERYTGREVSVRVTYMVAGAPFLPDDLCAMSIEVLP